MIGQLISQKPHKKLNQVFLLKLRPIQAGIQLLPILRDQEGQFHLLPTIVNLRFRYKLIIPPAIGQAQLTVNHEVQRTHPVTHIDALTPKIFVQVVGVSNVLQVHDDLRVSLRGRWEVVLMKEGLKGIDILNGRMGMEGDLLALPRDLKHEVISPLIIGEGGGQFIGESCDLPVDVALLPYAIDVIRDEPVVALYVQFGGVEGGEPFGEAETEDCADEFGVEAVGPRALLFQLPFEAEKEEAQDGLVL